MDHPVRVLCRIHMVHHRGRGLGPSWFESGSSGLGEVEVSGLEPPASSLRTTRSSQLSYTPEGPSSPKEGSA